MNYRLYTVMDDAAGEAGPLFCAVNDQVAARQFIHLLQDVPVVSKGDYRLFFVGEYDSVEMNVSSSVCSCIPVGLKTVKEE